MRVSREEGRYQEITMSSMWTRGSTDRGYGATRLVAVTVTRPMLKNSSCSLQKISS